MKEFYRYMDTHDRFGCHIDLTVFRMLRETECGYWIISDHFKRYEKPWPDGIVRMAERSKRWISKTSRKRFAYPTKEEALNNFKKRKERQIYWADANIARATAALSELEFRESRGKL